VLMRLSEMRRAPSHRHQVSFLRERPREQSGAEAGACLDGREREDEKKRHEWKNRGAN
jgi:hypothetical protein